MMKKLFATVMALLVTTALAMATPALAEGSPVDINTATVAELTTIKGIGPAKAQAIIDYREAHGGFESVDDLKMVRGIGDKVLDSLRPHLVANQAATTEAAKP
jgi:competence protein ComEA